MNREVRAGPMGNATTHVEAEQFWQVLRPTQAGDFQEKSLHREDDTYEDETEVHIRRSRDASPK